MSQWNGRTTVPGMHNEQTARVLDLAGGWQILRGISHQWECGWCRTSLEKPWKFDLPQGFCTVEDALNDRVKPRHELSFW
jgi:hypothetical protein